MHAWKIPKSSFCACFSRSARHSRRKCFRSVEAGEAGADVYWRHSNVRSSASGQPGNGSMKPCELQMKPRTLPRSR